MQACGGVRVGGVGGVGSGSDGLGAHEDETTNEGLGLFNEERNLKNLNNFTRPKIIYLFLINQPKRKHKTCYMYSFLVA